MTVSDRCIAAIQLCEGFRADAYQDCVGVWTIGYGETRGVSAGQHVSEAAAEQMLRTDVGHMEEWLNTMIHSHLNQDRQTNVTIGQFDAMCSFGYNLGPNALFHSTLWEHFVAGDLAAASAEFPKWCHAGDKVLPGLVKRRAQERQWFDEATSPKTSQPDRTGETTS